MAIIPVLGMDPSLTNWGLASANLDLETGFLTDLDLCLVRTKEEKGKSVRKNSKDLARAEQLASTVRERAQRAKAVFVEVPVGSQSARAMASYGICVGILGSLRAEGIPLIEVNPTEVKEALTGDRNASKAQMITEAVVHYPEADWPLHKGKVANTAEHLADAIASIHAGVRTPMFQNLMRIFKDI